MTRYTLEEAKDERVVRYMAMATPLGYQSALTVVQQMTALIEAETRARAAGVVAEEPEWEYRIAVGGEHEWPFGPRDEEQGAPLEEVQAALGGQYDNPLSGDIERRTKAVPAGPWMLVKQDEGR